MFFGAELLPILTIGVTPYPNSPSKNIPEFGKRHQNSVPLEIAEVPLTLGKQIYDRIL